MRDRGIYTVPRSPTRRYDKSVVITEPCVVIFDTQIPYHCAEFLNNILGLAESWGIQQGISGGDLLNMAAFSRFSERPEDKVWVKERNAATSVITAMLSAVPKWLLIMGNHENFLIKQLAEQIGHEDILRLLDRPKGVEASDYYHCEVKFGGSVWRVSHPRNISVIHGRVPQRLCDKFQCNLASGHGHLSGMTPSFSNKYWAIDVGVTCDPMRLDYYAIRDSTRPAMCQGALILMKGSDGKCYPYHLTPTTDWEAMRRLYK